MGCYCTERSTNPKLAESMKDLPAGFCGICDVCGGPGHTRAHPSLPTTGAWCDEHWQQLIAQPSVRPDRILAFIIILIAVISLAVAAWRFIG